MKRPTQTPTKASTVKDIMRRKWFRQGWKEIGLGLPPDYEAVRYRTEKRDDINAAWDYERGRMFGIIWGNRPYKLANGALCPHAVMRMKAALAAGEVI